MIRSTQPLLSATLLTLVLALQAGAQPAVPPSTKAAPAAKDAAKETAKKAAPVAAGKMVDLNQGSEADLVSLPGVGPATAKKIIAARPFKSVADLERAGVAKGTITKITPMVTVGTATMTPAMAPASKATPATKTQPNTPGAMAAGGGNGKVWVNKESKVFHREGDRWYGTTKKGEYMTEQAALAAGYREAKDGAVKKKK